MSELEKLIAAAEQEWLEGWPKTHTLDKSSIAGRRYRT
jgi:hypothetical protein